MSQSRSQNFQLIRSNGIHLGALPAGVNQPGLGGFKSCLVNWFRLVACWGRWVILLTEPESVAKVPP